MDGSGSVVPARVIPYVVLLMLALVLVQASQAVDRQT